MVRVLMTFFGCLLGWGYQFSEVVNPSEGINTVPTVYISPGSTNFEDLGKSEIIIDIILIAYPKELIKLIN